MHAAKKTNNYTQIVWKIVQSATPATTNNNNNNNNAVISIKQETAKRQTTNCNRGRVSIFVLLFVMQMWVNNILTHAPWMQSCAASKILRGILIILRLFLFSCQKHSLSSWLKCFSREYLMDCCWVFLSPITLHDLINRHYRKLFSQFMARECIELCIRFGFTLWHCIQLMPDGSGIWVGSK